MQHAMTGSCSTESKCLIPLLLGRPPVTNRSTRSWRWDSQWVGSPINKTAEINVETRIKKTDSKILLFTIIYHLIFQKHLANSYSRKKLFTTINYCTFNRREIRVIRVVAIGNSISFFVINHVQQWVSVLNVLYGTNVCKTKTDQVVKESNKKK